MVDRKSTRGRQQCTARGVAPSTDERRQARDGANRIAPAVSPLHPVVEPDCGRLDRAVIARKAQHLFDRNAARVRDTRRRPFRGARSQRFESNGVAIDVIAVQPIFGDQQMHHAKSERGVGSRQKRDVLMTLFGRRAAVGIDSHESCAAAFRFLDARPQMEIRRDRIAAPDQDQAAIFELLELHADRRTDHRNPSRFAGGRANRAIEQRGAEPMEETAVHRRALNESHRAAVAVRYDRLRSVARRGDRGEALGNLAQRFVPRYAREASFAFTTDPAHRMKNAIGRVRAIEIARHFRAQLAAGRRMRWIAADLHRLAVIDRHEHCARVGTIVRARGMDDAARRIDGNRIEGHTEIVPAHPVDPRMHCR